MIYTSGTTGHPKGVRRAPMSPDLAQAARKRIATVFGFLPGQAIRTVITGPMYHTAPNVYAHYAIRSQGLCVLQPRFDPEGLLALIEQHKITHLHMVPIMFVRLLRLPQAVRARYDLSSLRFVAHAAAPCPPQVKRAMIEWWGPVINEYYGTTETRAVVFHNSEEALKKPGTVGRPIEGGHVRIYDESSKALSAGQVGEVYLRVDGATEFQYHNRASDRAALNRDGLIRTGDVGYLDEDGYLFLLRPQHSRHGDLGRGQHLPGADRGGAAEHRGRARLRGLRGAG